MAKKKDRKSLISIYKQNLKEVNKRFNGATKEMLKSSLFENARAIFGTLTRTKNTRQISQGKIGNFGIVRLKQLIQQQQKFLQNPLTTLKGRQERYENWKKKYLASRPQAKKTTQDLYNLNDEQYEEFLDILSRQGTEKIFDKVLDVLQEEVQHDIREKTVVSSQMIIEAIKSGFSENAIDSAIFRLTSRVYKEENKTGVELDTATIYTYWWEELDNLRNA